MGIVVIAHQPHFLPSIEYFARWQAADVFIIRDEVQFSKADWQHRNRIPDRHGNAHWMTLPLKKGVVQDEIRDKELADDRWAKHMTGLIRSEYSPSTARDLVCALLEDHADRKCLVDVSIPIARVIAGYLRVHRPVYLASELIHGHEGKNEDLIKLVKSVGGTEYWCGQVAYDSYISPQMFADSGILVRTMRWAGYAQRKLSFTPSVIDVLMTQSDYKPFMGHMEA